MKYSVTKEGAKQYRELSNKLRTTNQQITEVGNRLKGGVNGLTGLGDFASEIQDLTATIVKDAKKTTDAVDSLCTKLNTLAAKIDIIVSKL